MTNLVLGSLLETLLITAGGLLFVDMLATASEHVEQRNAGRTTFSWTRLARHARPATASALDHVEQRSRAHSRLKPPP